MYAPSAPDPASPRSRGERRDDRVVLVLWSVGRLGGMERAVVELGRELALRIPTTIVVGRCEAEALTAIRRRATGCTVEVGVARVVRVAQFPRRAERVIVVGVFTIARLAWCPAGRRSRLVLWEHAVTVDRILRDRRIRVLARLARRSYRRSPAVCPSVAVAAALTAAGASAPIVIANILQRRVSPQAPVAAPDGVRLGIVGRLEPVRDPLRALDVLEHLDTDFRVEVFGDGSLMGAVRSEVARRGLQRRVTLHGWVEDRDEIMRGIDVLVSLSTSETFGYSLLEAAEAHVPVVALDVGAVSEIVPRFVPGRVVGVDASAEAVAAVIRQLVEARPSPGELAAADALRRDSFAAATVADAWCSVLNVDPRARATVP